MITTETIGSIFDKLSILEIKESVAIADGADCIFIDNIRKQKSWIMKEMGNILSDIFSNKRPARFKKMKMYDKNIQKESEISFIKLINDLQSYNCELWKLEDMRRDKNNSDEFRLEAADNIAKFNKLRNDSIDLIDDFIQTCKNKLREGEE